MTQNNRKVAAKAATMSQQARTLLAVGLVCTAIIMLCVMMAAMGSATTGPAFG